MAAGDRRSTVTAAPPWPCTKISERVGHKGRRDAGHGSWRMRRVASGRQAAQADARHLLLSDLLPGTDRAAAQAERWPGQSSQAIGARGSGV